MQSTNRKVFDKLVSRTKIYLVIILILLIAISVQNSRMIIPSVIVYILVLWYAYFANNKRKNEISEKLQDLMLSVDTAANIDKFAISINSIRNRWKYNMEKFKICIRI